MRNLVFMAPAGHCKGQELSAASWPSPPLGLAARWASSAPGHFQPFPGLSTAQPVPSLPATGNTSWCSSYSPAV